MRLLQIRLPFRMYVAPFTEDSASGSYSSKLAFHVPELSTPVSTDPARILYAPIVSVLIEELLYIDLNTESTYKYGFSESISG